MKLRSRKTRFGCAILPFQPNYKIKINSRPCFRRTHGGELQCGVVRHKQNDRGGAQQITQISWRRRLCDGELPEPAVIAAILPNKNVYTAAVKTKLYTASLLLLTDVYTFYAQGGCGQMR